MTLYDKLKVDLTKAGYKVAEGTWVEKVGYKKPTSEYWLDVTLKDEDNTELAMHYWFKNNKDVLLKVEVWISDYERVEKRARKIS